MKFETAATRINQSLSPLVPLVPRWERRAPCPLLLLLQEERLRAQLTPTFHQALVDTCDMYGFLSGSLLHRNTAGRLETALQEGDAPSLGMVLRFKLRAMVSRRRSSASTLALRLK